MIEALMKNDKEPLTPGISPGAEAPGPPLSLKSWGPEAPDPISIKPMGLLNQWDQRVQIPLRAFIVPRIFKECGRTVSCSMYDAPEISTP